jgi:hypothetical protein
MKRIAIAILIQIAVVALGYIACIVLAMAYGDRYMPRQ